MSRLGVAVLCLHEGAAGRDHGQFVAPDAAREDFFLPCGGIEAPGGAALYERDGKRPVLVADDQRLAGGTNVLQPPAFGNGDSEHLAVAARGRQVG